MTLDELTAQIRLNIDDRRGTKYSNTELRLTINNSYRQIYQKLVSLGKYTARTTVTTTIAAGTQEKVVNALMLRPILVVNSSGIRIPIQSQTMSVQSDIPSVYFIQSSSSTLFNVGYFNKVGSDLVLTIVYASRFQPYTSLSDGSRVLYFIPEDYHNIIATHASIVLSGSDDDKSLTNFWENQYRVALAELIESVDQFNPDDQETVDVVDDYA